MAENRYQHPQNGAEVRRQDINLMSDDAGLADDRTLWELLRLVTGSATPQKGILPYGKSGWAAESGLTSTALVHGNASNGSVLVMPFRAIVGSTNTSDETEQLRGQRSGYLVGASTQYTTVALAANASGNPRIDLIYAIVEPDADGDAADVVRKDPAAPHTISTLVAEVITKKTTVTVDKVTGATGATPARPSLPADGGGLYYIPLAYVWVPTGFTAASAVGRGAIYEVAPCLPIHSSVGVTERSPANQQHAIGGTVDANQTVGTDGALQNGAYLPPTMVGGKRIEILVQLGYAPVSHLDGDVIDTSIDWRFRYFDWKVHALSGATTAFAFPSDRRATGVAPAASASFNTFGTHLAIGVGQSFVDDSTSCSLSGGSAVADSAGVALYVTNTECSQLNEYIVIYVRDTDGALIFKREGTGSCQIRIVLEASGPYSNYGTV